VADGYRIGVDIGGTFTDVVLLGSDGRLRTKKVLSTPADYARGVVDGIGGLLQEAGVAPASITEVVHATTVASNAVIEGKGSTCCLLTTAGFRDVLELRRLRIPVMYELQYEKPRPLVPRRLRYEIPERSGPRGEEWAELDEQAVREAAERARAEGVVTVAISFLHAYANPTHERRAAELVREVVGDDVYITCSSEILSEIREYERTSTAVVNAYIGPVVQRYIRSLESNLAEAGISAPLQIMQSSGGLMSADAAIRKPAYLVESGPAAGVVACAFLARTTGIPNVISLDMGGTTAKAAILEDGLPVKTSEYEVGAGINLSSRLIKGGGHAIRLPFIDLSEIGAGGGSLVSVDGFGMLHVGPESAGADPGPACYGLGGDAPTLTDALVVLGYLNPEYLAGGAVAVDADAAARAVERSVAAPLGRDALEAAFGVFELAVATMTRAVKAVSTYRGRDPREFVLCGFGGNGPVVAVAIARALQMRRVLVPLAPGVFSAAGLLLSEIEHEFVRTLPARGESASPDVLHAVYRELEAEAERALVAEGVSREAIVIARFADVRYAGQAYELTMPVAAGSPDLARITVDFNAEHHKTYGHASADAPIDIVNVKLTARTAGNGDKPYDPLAGLGAEVAGAGGPSGRTRRAYFGRRHGSLDVPVISRAALLGSASREGPLIVEEYDATCVVPPGSRVTLDSFGNIDIVLDEEPR
jgi:N-methylhydantoinase A